MGAPSLFIEGRNCWRATTATCAAVVVDCGNYYRDLYESICRARHSIFVLGWDIDSRIELLRGHDAEHRPYPVTFFDLIQAKAAENPRLMVYLNRWNYSLLFARERESFSEFRWRMRSPENVHFCLDSAVPNGACHHQKIIVIDDEVAFCGGMDIALGRWDFRDHHLHNDDRIDPGGGLQYRDRVSFGPYHDVQVALAGPVVKTLAALARERWKVAAGYDPLPVRDCTGQTPPPAWPPSDPPVFFDVPVAVSLTVPSLLDAPPVRQAERLYLDMISRAERIIYIENQFLTFTPVAAALNKRLKERPNLQALLVSCDEPHGYMEKKAMWTGRARFRDILEKGIAASRVVIATPLCVENGEAAPVRIHSKIMIVDDQYLRIGSSNLAMRAMRLDTECDVIIEARDSRARKQISCVRNGLIAEHTGFAADEVARMIASGAPIDGFLRFREGSGHHLVRVNDDRFRAESLAGLARAMADPGKPLIPPELTIPHHYPGTRRSWRLRLFSALPPVLLIIGLALMWKTTGFPALVDPQHLAPLMDRLGTSPPALLGITIVMTAAEFCLFPLVIINASAAAAFGPTTGFAMSMIASMMTAALGFGAGRLLGLRVLRIVTGSVVDRVARYIRRGGILSIVVLRTIPVAPFNAVNLGLGVSSAAFGDYMMGTFLGIAPGTVVTSFAGHSLAQFWRHADANSLMLVAMAALCWIIIVTIVHFLVRRWQDMYFAGRSR